MRARSSRSRLCCCVARAAKVRQQQPRRTHGPPYRYIGLLLARRLAETLFGLGQPLLLRMKLRRRLLERQLLEAQLVQLALLLFLLQKLFPLHCAPRERVMRAALIDLAHLHSASRMASACSRSDSVAC